MNAADINQNLDLLALAEGDTTLRRVGAYYIGPCPMPGCQADQDGFVLKHTYHGWRWYCRKCGNGKYHTVLDYIMRRHNMDFKTALASLGGDPSCPALYPRPERLRTALIDIPRIGWQENAWLDQTGAVKELLQASSGEVGRRYLEERGFLRSTWMFANLGFVQTYDPEIHSRRPAISIPHFDHAETITGIKYRFIDSHRCGLRYIARLGSKFYLYGLFDLTTTANTLLILEGELNALSVMQCRPAGVNILSIGSDNFTEAQASLLKPLVGRHRRVTIWMDEPTRSNQVRAALARGDAQRLKSPIVEGQKYDANQLLQAGLLADFLSTVLHTECLGIVPREPVTTRNTS